MKQEAKERMKKQPMAETFNKTNTYKTRYSTFGGLIFSSDFNTGYQRKENRYGSPIARQIEKDKHFDEQCRRNIENRQNRETKM